MTDDELKALVASLAVAQQKTDEQMRKTDEQMTRTDEQILSLLESQKETDRKLEKVSDLLGGIGKNQGDVAEEFFFNSLVDDAHLGAIHFDDIATNMKKHRGKIQEEYDLVMTNGDAIGIV